MTCEHSIVPHTLPKHDTQVRIRNCSFQHQDFVTHWVRQRTNLNGYNRDEQTELDHRMTASNLLSIVIPAFNEADGLEGSVAAIRAHAEPLGPVEYIIVDDGSTDATWHTVEKICAELSNVEGIKLSRNFGKEAAIMAGLKAANGTALISIDSDLQHPPELIPQMFAKWQKGAKVVNTVKETRGDEGPLKAWLTRCYFSLFRKLAGIDVGNASDFKLLDREVVDLLVSLPERQRFYRGLVGWLGFEQETIKFEVAPRVAGETKWSPTTLTRLALDSIVSFSTTPMHLMTLLGASFAVLALALSARTLWLWVMGQAVPGISTVILLLIIIGSILMIGLGIIGIYIAKIYEEVKDRPTFIVQQRTSMDHEIRDSDKDQVSQTTSAVQSAP